MGDLPDTRGLDAAQLLELADRLLEQTAHRGLFVRLSAAFAARELRRRAAQAAARLRSQGSE